MTRPVRLVVSPHLDDAVFSCPAWMLAAQRAGSDVAVLSVFSHAGSVADAASEALYEERRREDSTALGGLGATPIHGGMADAPFRSTAYRSFEGIVLGPLADDDPAPARVASLLDATVARIRPTAIHTLLGVGTHVDHRIVFDAVRALERRRPELDVTYGEDRPYSLVRGAVAVRLRQLRCASPGAVLPAEAAEFSNALLQAPYVARHVAAAQRERIGALAREHLRTVSAIPVESTATADSIPWSRDDAARFLQAMQHYATQFEAFFGSPDEARDWLGLTSRLLCAAVCCERIWRLGR